MLICSEWMFVFDESQPGHKCLCLLLLKFLVKPEFPAGQIPYLYSRFV